jgi:hypothetical protein
MNFVKPIPGRLLTTFEWKIVKMARADCRWRFKPDGILGSVASLFGAKTRLRFKDQGLESLRSFCVRAWHSDLIGSSDLRRLIDAGYSSAHVFEILAYVTSLRGFSPSLQTK